MLSTTLFVQEPDGSFRPAVTDEIVGAAGSVLDARFLRLGEPFATPQIVRDFLSVKLGLLEHEVFAVIYIDSQNRLLEFDIPFRGSLTQTSVYPREIVKKALQLNAAATILAHNHPSGTLEASRADEALTKTLKSALALVDVRILDHFIIGGSRSYSMAEHGLL